MAKLFEEVINGTARLSSADILIHFASLGDPPPLTGNPASGLSPGGSVCACGGGDKSPRVGPPASNSSASPSRGPPTGAGEAGHGLPTSIACHSLVLRTQPTLIDILFPELSSRQASTGWRPNCARPASPLSVDADLQAQVAESLAPPASLTEPSDGQDVEGRSLSQPPACPVSPGADGRGSSQARPGAGDYEGGRGMAEVTVSDESEVFLEMLRFVYMNTCNVDHSNVKALMHVADKYGIEDIVTHCLQWMHDHFTASLFYHFITFKLTNDRFGQLVRQNLLLTLRSRRHFSVVSETSDNSWEQLPVSFVEALLGSDELPVVSEAEVLHLLARWATGALARQDHDNAQRTTGQTCSPAPSQQEGNLSFPEDDDRQQAQSVGDLSADLDADGTGEASGAETGAEKDPKSGAAAGSLRANAATSSTSGLAAGASTTESNSGRPEDSTSGSGEGNAENVMSGGSGGNELGDRRGDSPEGAPLHRVTSWRLDDSEIQQDMLRLLRTFRKSDMYVKISDFEPIFKILNFPAASSKPPRETAALDPGFMLYRGVAGVTVAPGFGEYHPVPNVVPETWRGGSVSLGSHDFLQQQDGFRPGNVPDGGSKIFPRLWVRINCSSWSHREKRQQPKQPSSRHNPLGPMGSDVSAAAWESAIMPMAPVAEGGGGCMNEKLPPTLRSMQSQDDWEIGRGKQLVRPGSAVPNLTDNEKIQHKVVCAVISGHMRHGIRIGQHERSSIYNIEELCGQCGEVCLGGSPTEVEFELQLTVQAPSHCGICQCTLAMLGTGSQDQSPAPLLEVSFDASAEEPLLFTISSNHFDSNSSYSVSLNWALRPGEAVSY